MPGGHAAHAAWLVAPVVFKKLPAGQGVQNGAALALDQVPAGHSVQAALAPNENEPAGHPRHSCAPRAAENVPVGQGSQLAEPGAAAKKPAAQRVQLVLPGALKEPGWHGWQEALDVAPVALFAVPAGQNVQLDMPGVFAKVPLGQLMQVALLVALTALDDVPVGHCMHKAEVIWKVPAGQGKMIFPSIAISTGFKLVITD